MGQFPMRSWSVRCPAAQYTEALGRALGLLLFPGAVVALVGELGAGKTTFARGVLEGLGVHGYLHSPSFSLVHEYPGPVYHLDFYRLEQPQTETALDWEEYLGGEGVALVEWADRFGELLPPRRLEVRLEVLPDGARRISLTAHGTALAAVVAALAATQGESPGL